MLQFLLWQRKTMSFLIIHVINHDWLSSVGKTAINEHNTRCILISVKLWDVESDSEVWNNEHDNVFNLSVLLKYSLNQQSTNKQLPIKWKLTLPLSLDLRTSWQYTYSEILCQLTKPTKKASAFYLLEMMTMRFSWNKEPDGPKYSI